MKQSPVLQQRDSGVDKDSPLVEWWIRATSPAPGSPAAGRNPQWREEVTSLLFPIIIVNVLLPIPTALNNPPQLAILLVVALIDIAAIFFKKAGLLRLSGVIVVTTIEFGLAAAVLTVPGGFDATNMPMLDLMIQADLVAMAFFSPWSVGLLTLLNTVFILFVMNNLPHTAILNQRLAANFWGVVFPSIILQVFIGVIAYVIIRTLLNAIHRADQAEALAEMERREKERQQQEIELKSQLEIGIQQVLTTLNTAANGDFGVRAPIRQDNILWRIGYAINNLLARLQSFKSEREELDKTKLVANQLITYFKTGKPPRFEGWTGTCLDPLIVEMSRNTNQQSGSAQLPPSSPHPRQREF